MPLQIITIDPGFFKGSDATNHMCEACGLRPARHVHHKEFKKIGGSGKKQNAYIERNENHMHRGTGASYQSTAA